MIAKLERTENGYQLVFPWGSILGYESGDLEKDHENALLTAKANFPAIEAVEEDGVITRI